METNSVKFFNSNIINSPSFSPIVAAWQVKNPQNVGSLMRLVDNVGGKQLFLLDDENEKRISQIKKTAGLSFNHVEICYKDSADFLQNIPEGYQLCAVETSEGATNIFQTCLPEKIILLVGSEAHGLPEELLSKADLSVFIPMTGECKSMNISHALAVSLFEWQRQSLFMYENSNQSK